MTLMLLAKADPELVPVLEHTQVENAENFFEGFPHRIDHEGFMLLCKEDAEDDPEQVLSVYWLDGDLAMFVTGPMLISKEESEGVYRDLTPEEMKEAEQIVKPWFMSHDM